MKGRQVRLLAAAGLLAVGLAACSSSTGGGGSNNSSGNTSSGSGSIKTGPGVDSATKTITLGVLTPLSGPAALIGKPLTDGQQSYFDWLNANGGIDGWKIKLDVQDSKYDPQTQVADYNQIVNNVLFIGQSLGSPTTQAIEPLAKSAGILIGTAAQDSAFVNTDVNAVIGTPYAVDVANAMYYVSQHMPSAKLGIIYQNDSYGADGLKGFTAGVNAYHLHKVASATYNVTDTSFTSQVLAMRNAGATAVMVTAIPPAAATIIGTAAAQGYHPQWILQGPAWSEYLMTSTGALGGKPTPVEQAMVGSWVLGYEAGWGDTSAPGMAQFLQIQKQYFPAQVPDGYYMYGYCMAQMEADVLRKAIANKDLTRPGVLNAKLNLGPIDFGGLIPNATYSPSLGPADRETTVYQVNTTSPGFTKALVPFFTSSAAQSMTFSSSG
jgi:ABC-type branched-subunit amino acid transport system substrate-binding protein